MMTPWSHDRERGKHMNTFQVSLKMNRNLDKNAYLVISVYLLHYNTHTLIYEFHSSGVLLVYNKVCSYCTYSKSLQW